MAIKINPSKIQTTKSTSAPASSRQSDEEIKCIQLKVSKKKHTEIKIYAAERGMTVKDLILSLFDNERMKK